MREIWKSVPGHKHYEASSLGRIRSVARTVKQKGRWGGSISYFRKGTILKPLQGSHNYQTVILGKTQKRLYLHRVVCCVFHGKAPSPRHQVNHINGNRLDNRAKNLQWVTSKENSQHANRIGLIASGQDRANAKLSNKQILKIKKILANKIPKKPPYFRDIAKRFGVSAKYIEAVAYGKRWKRVTLNETPSSLQRHSASTFATRHRKT